MTDWLTETETDDESLAECDTEVVNDMEAVLLSVALRDALTVCVMEADLEPVKLSDDDDDTDTDRLAVDVTVIEALVECESDAVNDMRPVVNDTDDNDPEGLLLMTDMLTVVVWLWDSVCDLRVTDLD